MQTEEKKLQVAIEVLFEAMERGSPEDEVDELFRNAEKLSPSPNLADIVFYSELTDPAEIARRAFEYRPIILLAAGGRVPDLD